MKAVIHHTAAFAKEGSKQFSSIDASHKKRFGRKSRLGFYVGYHFLIERDGTVRQARDLSERGYHTYNEKTQTDYGDYIGICLVGNFNDQEPSQAQIFALKRLLKAELKIAREDVYLHRGLDQTACPGAKLTQETVSSLYAAQVSLWAREAVEKAKKKGITRWDAPNQVIADETLRAMLYKLKLVTREHGKITKEEMAVILDRVGLLD